MKKEFNVVEYDKELNSEILVFYIGAMFMAASLVLGYFASWFISIVMWLFLLLLFWFFIESEKKVYTAEVKVKEKKSK